MCLVIKDKLDEVFLIFLYMLLPHAAIKPESSPELSVVGTLLVGHCWWDTCTESWEVKKV